MCHSLLLTARRIPWLDFRQGAPIFTMDGGIDGSNRRYVMQAPIRSSAVVRNSQGSLRAPRAAAPMDSQVRADEAGAASNQDSPLVQHDAGFATGKMMSGAL
jgi:hypothetical protein